MELFVIKNKSNEVVQGGFSKKDAAKKIRDQLQADSKNGLPKPEDRMKQSAWDFRISYGKDHSRLSPVGKH